jgi:predicted enzyme related to lactoylglutathione lyase
MISGGNATLYVKDLSRAIRFYVEILGFKLMVHEEGAWAEIDAGNGLVLGLHPEMPHGPKAGAAGSIAIGLDVNIPIDEAVEVLANRSVKVAPPMTGKGAKIAPFTDPDGNALYLFERLKKP